MNSRRKKQLEEFHDVLVERRTLPPNFVRDVIMKASSPDMMNSISRSILQLYSYDEKADDTSIPNVLRQCLNLISQFPMLMVYGYHAYNYKMGEDHFYIRTEAGAVHSREYSDDVKRRPEIYRARGKDSRHGAGTSYGSRRR